MDLIGFLKDENNARVSTSDCWLIWYGEEWIVLQHKEEEKDQIRKEWNGGKGLSIFEIADRVTKSSNSKSNSIGKGKK